MNVLVRGDIQHHGVQTDVNAGLTYHVDEAPGILRAGQLFLEIVQTEAVVDALVEDAAQLTVALDDADRATACFPCGIRSGQTCRAAADNHEFVFHASVPPLVVPIRIKVPSPSC